MKRLVPSLLGIIALLSSHLAAADLKFSIAPNFFEKTPAASRSAPAIGGTVIDKAGNIYVTTDTPRGILVFSPDGKFVRAFGPTKIHGLEIREENGAEVIYGARPSAHEVIKLKLDGRRSGRSSIPRSRVRAKTRTASIHAPSRSVPMEASSVADGYGSNHIFKFDKDRKLCEGVSVPPAHPGILQDLPRHRPRYPRGKVAPLRPAYRNNNRVECTWDLDGNFVKVIQADLRMPAAVHIRGDYAVIPELQGRVTVLDKSGAIVAQVGDQPGSLAACELRPQGRALERRHHEFAARGVHRQGRQSDRFRVEPIRAPPQVRPVEVIRLIDRSPGRNP